MNRHAGPPRAADAPTIPEPTFAERARTLAYLGRTGSLATLSRRHPGHPFASVMPYALDADGRPLFLISSMAMHTQNLEADARASLLVTQPYNRRFLSGFTGEDDPPLDTAGFLLIGRTDICLITDGRYKIQAEDELPSCARLFQAPQDGHLPCHLFATAPQDWQT